jgi:hypothetical protein
LVDYNQELLELMSRLLKLNLSFTPTTEYKLVETELDFRTAIHPKKESLFSIKPYYQVFEDRNNFIENLGIVDLLFNQGPQSNHYF